MSVFLCTAIIILTFLGADLRMTLDLRAAATKNDYFMKFILFGISIIRVRISYDGFDLGKRYLWLKINGRSVGIALTADMLNPDSVFNYISSPILKALDFKYINLKLTLGIANDAFLSAMALQLIRSVYYSAVAVIANRQILKTEEKFIVDCAGNNANIELIGIISLTPANIIYSLFKAFGRKMRATKAKEVRVDNK